MQHYYHVYIVTSAFYVSIILKMGHISVLDYKMELGAKLQKQKLK
jgi:hypothetical protein